MIDVLESKEDTQKFADRSQFTFPVLLDSDGAVAKSYAPSGVLPDLPRDQVVIASNLIIDADGKIDFFSLLDTTSFDAKLIALRKRLDRASPKGQARGKTRAAGGGVAITARK